MATKNSRAGPERENRTASRSKDVRYSGSSTTYSNACKRYSNNTTSAGGGLCNLVLVSWLEDAGKDVIYVQNTETNDVQKITSEPNLDNFRIVELRPNADPNLSEAVISNGSQQGPVRFRF